MSKQHGLPPGWAWTTLDEVASIQLGKMLSPKAHDPGLQQRPYLRNENVRWGSIDYTDVKSMGFHEHELIKFQLAPGDLLVCEGGEAGRCAVYKGPPGHYFYQKALHRVRVHPSLAASEWLQYCLHHYALSRTILPRLSETTIQHLPLEKMKVLPVPVAPLAEQHRIVAAIEQQFTRLDAGVAALRRVRAALKRYRAAVLKAAVEGQLTADWRAAHPDAEPASALLARILAERRARWEADLRAKGKDPAKVRYGEPAAPDTTNLPALPEGWCWATVEQLAAPEPTAITDGPFGSNLKTEHYRSEGMRVIRLQNIGDGVFRDELAFISPEHFDSLGKHRIFAGDLVIAALGDSPPRSCIIPSFVGPAIVKADCIRFKVSPHVLADYANASLNSEPTRQRTAALLHGIGRPRLNLSEVKSIIVPLPPLAEQHEIVAEVERRLSVVSEVEAAIAANLTRAERLRQSILERAFSGRLVPQDPNDEPASALLERIRREREAAVNTRAKNRQPEDRPAVVVTAQKPLWE